MDYVVDELKDLLLQLSGSQAVDEEDLLSHPSEQWTASPVESDNEDAKFPAAYRARERSDEEEADDNESVVPMTLREARVVGENLKIFVQRIRVISGCIGIYLPLRSF